MKCYFSTQLKVSIFCAVFDARAQKMKMHLDTANPYGDRPGSAKAYKDALAHLMRAMNELDNPENMPEGLDLPVWERFCSARRTKVESEQLVCKVPSSRFIFLLIVGNILSCYLL